MVDPQTARTGLEALAMAITEIMENAQDVAIRPLPSESTERLVRLVALRIVGEDMAALAAAMEVLERRRAVSMK